MIAVCLYQHLFTSQSVSYKSLLLKLTDEALEESIFEVSQPTPTCDDRQKKVRHKAGVAVTM